MAFFPGFLSGTGSKVVYGPMFPGTFRKWVSLFIERRLVRIQKHLFIGRRTGCMVYFKEVTSDFSSKNNSRTSGKFWPSRDLERANDRIFVQSVSPHGRKH